MLQIGENFSGPFFLRKFQNDIEDFMTERHDKKMGNWQIFGNERTERIMEGNFVDDA